MKIFGNMRAGVNVVLSLTLMLIFFIGHSIHEWPDAHDQIERSISGEKFYPPASVVDSYAESPVLSNTHTFFSSTHMYAPSGFPIAENVYRAPFVIAFILLICYVFQVSGFKYASFSPPLIFALAQPSQEAFAIFIFVMGFVLIESRRILGFAILLLSTFIDRSMVPSVILLFFINFVPFALDYIKRPRLGLFVCFFVAFLSKNIKPFHFLSELTSIDISFYNLSLDDVVYNSNFGERNIEALAASVMGLYGWMSIRPEPFWLYYLVVIIAFFYGFAKTDDETKSMFYASLTISILTMWILPPISQARYYPILCIVFWRVIYNGLYASAVEKRFAFNFFLLSATAAGLILPFLK